MTLWIDPTFATYLPVIGYFTAMYISVMVGRGMAARRALKAMKG